MGDHFVLLVDRLLTESTLEATIESRNRSKQVMPTSIDETKIDFSPRKTNLGNVSSPTKIVECRICQDEDEDSNMETPCSCCGSLKVSRDLVLKIVNYICCSVFKLIFRVSLYYSASFLFVNLMSSLRCPLR